MFLPWHLGVAYILDLIFGDPPWWPHPVRWMGSLINWLEWFFYDGNASPNLQRLAGFFFWTAVMVAVMSGTFVLLGLSFHVHPALGHVVTLWLACSALATRSLHKESEKVTRALREGNLPLARKRLGWIVSRDTKELEEKDIVRALIETVAENLSDGIVAPLFFLAVGGPLWAMAYKAMNTLDSMVGYMNDRYRYFGSFAARADDVANWIPARLSGMLLVGAAACLKLDWRAAWRIMHRDANKMKSPNAGYPEGAAAGALNIQLGGTSIYFGHAVEKPTLGDPLKPLTVDGYSSMVRLMYAGSLLALLLGVVMRAVILFFHQ